MVSTDIPVPPPPTPPPPPPEAALISAVFARRLQGSVASEILPSRLYISDLSVAHDQNGLTRLGITHVVSVLEPVLAPVLGPSFTQLHIDIEDSFQANILQHFDRTTDFIRETLTQREDTKVLVHCMMGVSRSVSVVCAYLIAERGMTAPEALTCVRAQRKNARPNVGFARQLETYAERYRGSEKGAESTVPECVRELFAQDTLSLQAETTKAKVQDAMESMPVAAAMAKVVA